MLTGWRRTAAVTLALGASLATGPSGAAEITVTHYGVSMYGVPYAVAKASGAFKAAGMDTPGFLTSQGGGTSVRNALASELPYGEVATSAAIAAIKQGLPIKIVNSAVNTVGDILWVARKDDERVKRPEDLAGLTVGYSSPKGGTDTVLSEIIRVTGVKVDKRAVGGVGPSLTALREKGVDVAWTQEPIWSRDKDQYRLVFNSADFIPKISQTVGIVRADYLAKHPDVIRAIIEARRRGVDAVYKDPGAAADIAAAEFRIDPKVFREAIDNVRTVKGVDYWSRGDIDYEGLETSLRVLQSVGAVDDKPIDWASVVSEVALPDDLKRKAGAQVGR
ncbi:ABC transporter substrate-binding protein [Methylobacterium sp. NEAU 140]|uniref:ABC transporter substrate-binding protein n=1 Tax=Methylobacterium sp. NEAU 140 TaxID=3064945 RepID=UPI0027333657|nr:ABC transporter substrate-binding protein [Methylobacterium sp. NEAU 140]MDP4023968.1 ABC transporter substrate-binding protein [Methylobacterium sp. NEAU 140]